MHVVESRHQIADGLVCTPCPTCRADDIGGVRRKFLAVDQGAVVRATVRFRMLCRPFLENPQFLADLDAVWVEFRVPFFELCHRDVVSFGDAANDVPLDYGVIDFAYGSAAAYTNLLADLDAVWVKISVPRLKVLDRHTVTRGDGGNGIACDDNVDAIAAGDCA